ncbi:hypothetical protein [Pseudomonas lactis]|uniref:hypothetical protein n=1 Tax=Pseudomonas lactis TaxID=1615674 RepID=UPI001A02361E|nr:hypothetical protein [Pseudomonas lactis]MBA6043789.1 hypothetical protein [Pseudomonas lactis]
MQVKLKYKDRLGELLVMPHISPRSRLIVVRRIARICNSQWVETREYFRELIKEAELGLPFTTAKLKKIDAMRSEARSQHKATSYQIGQWIYENDDLLTKLYGFDGVCEVLEVNPVHRPEVLEYAEDQHRAIAAVAFIAGMEESASRQSGRQRPDYKDGPLFNVFMDMMIKAMKENRASMPDPTAPGGPLYGLPSYTMQADGSMVMNTPAVTVHSADGSKVVASKPGRRNGPVTPSKVATLFANNENVSRHEGGQT